MSLIRYQVDPLRISGTYDLGTYREEWDNYNPLNRSQYAYCNTVTPIDNGYWVTKALANLNPNKPEVDLPVFLFELREFPRMLMQAGRVLQSASRLATNRSLPGISKGGINRTDVAGSYLAYSFGWAPLVSDLLKLLKLEEAVSRRVNYLKRGTNGGGKVKRSLGTVDIPRSGGPYVVAPWLSAPLVFEGAYTVTETQKVWYVANMQLLDDLPKDNPEMRRVARKAALGLNLSAATLWEAMPWSWLIDYFVNIGDILEANRGGIRFRAYDLNLMCTRRVVNELSGSTKKGLTFSGGRLTTVAKSRSVHPIPLPRLAFRPFWTPHMIGIVASLALVTAMRGGSPGKSIPGIK